MRLHRASVVVATAAAIFMTVPPSRPLRAEEVAAAPNLAVSGLAARVAALLPSVAEIKTIADTPQGRMFFDGSGFVIDPDGVIVTNRHVIAGAYEITAILPGQPPLAAKPLFVSDWLDVAILKVDAGGKLPAVKLGNSDTVRVGDPVLLLGNPLGVGHSLSTGVISAVNRDIGETMFDHFFQTDAALNHGNSGGPMFDMKGEVIAINTGLTSSPGNTGSIGIGYALPINDAKFIIDQYLRTGQVHAGGIGVRAQRLSRELAAAFGLPAPRGAIVTEVDPDGPAAGKVLNGDILLRVNDQDAADTRAVARLVAVTPPGKTVQIHLLRGGAELDVPVTVRQITDNPKSVMTTMGHAPAERMAFATPSNPGMTLAPVTEQMRAKLGLRPGQTGVVVTAVAPHGVAAEHRIGVDEVIEAVGMQKVSTPEDVKQALTAITAKDQRYAPLLVLGQQGPRWVPLELEADRQ
jgi:serine protease Do